jgi:hypothetical protein
MTMDENLDERAKQFKEKMRAEAERMYPGAEWKKINPSELRPAPIRHESLSADLLKTIKQLYDNVGCYLHPTLEQWELGFMRDTHPESEVAVWVQIAMAWQDYHQRYANGKRLEHNEEEKLVGALVSFSMGAVETEQLKVSEKVGRRLLDCYLTAVNQ